MHLLRFNGILSSAILGTEGSTSLAPRQCGVCRSWLCNVRGPLRSAVPSQSCGSRVARVNISAPRSSALRGQQGRCNSANLGSSLPFTFSFRSCLFMGKHIPLTTIPRVERSRFHLTFIFFTEGKFNSTFVSAFSF